MNFMNPGTRAGRRGAAALFAFAAVNLWSSPVALADTQDPAPAAPDSDSDSDNTAPQQSPGELGSVADKLGSAGDKLRGIADGNRDSGDGDGDQQSSGSTRGLVKGLGLVFNKFMDTTAGGSHGDGPQVLDPATGNMSSNIDPVTGLPKTDGPHKDLGDSAGGGDDGGLTQAFGSILGGVVGAGPSPSIGSGPGSGSDHPENQLPDAANNGLNLLTNVLGKVSDSDMVHNIADGGKNVLDGGREDPAAHHDESSSDDSDDGN